MKNLKSLRLVGILALVAVVAMVAIASTYARYTTSSTGSDSARVAHWKVNMTNTVEDLFATSYTNVKAGADQAAIIAPGTSGSYTFKISGDVETAYALDVVATGTDAIDNYETDGYAPITYTFQKGSETATTCTSFSDLLEKINAISGRYAQGAGPLKDSTETTYTIGWSWAGEVGDTTEAKATNNGKDTTLGNSVVGENKDKKVTLSVAITATQILGAETVNSGN